MTVGDALSRQSPHENVKELPRLMTAGASPSSTTVRNYAFYVGRTGRNRLRYPPTPHRSPKGYDDLGEQSSMTWKCGKHVDRELHPTQPRHQMTYHRVPLLAAACGLSHEDVQNNAPPGCDPIGGALHDRFLGIGSRQTIRTTARRSSAIDCVAKSSGSTARWWPTRPRSRRACCRW